MTSIALLALVWFPYVGAGAEIAHDLGVDTELRGSIDIAFDAEVLKTQSWTLEINTSVTTFVRENGKNETLFRISPQQVHYPVGARLRFPLTKETAWALVARHQSNHDVDTNDEMLNRETISFEVYGAQFLGNGYTLEAGLYYDRGTRIDGSKQYWPFDYYLAGLSGRTEWPRLGPWYTAFDARVLFHRNEKTSLPHVAIGGHIDAGWRFSGRQGQFRAFARTTRISDYQQLGDEAHHMIMLGVSVLTTRPKYRPGVSPITKF